MSVERFSMVECQSNHQPEASVFDDLWMRLNQQSFCRIAKLTWINKILKTGISGTFPNTVQTFSLSLRGCSSLRVKFVLNVVLEKKRFILLGAAVWSVNFIASFAWISTCLEIRQKHQNLPTGKRGGEVVESPIFLYFIFRGIWNFVVNSINSTNFCGDILRCKESNFKENAEKLSWWCWREIRKGINDIILQGNINIHSLENLAFRCWDISLKFQKNITWQMFVTESHLGSHPTWKTMCLSPSNFNRSEWSTNYVM